METLTVKVDSRGNVDFLRKLLSKFSFVKAIETNEEKPNGIKEKYKTLPIHWATEKPKVDDFTNIIEGRKLSLTEIREKAWKRNW